MPTWAWGVIDDKGRRAVFLDLARAQQYAAEHHGAVVPLAPIGAGDVPALLQSQAPQSDGDPLNYGGGVAR